MSILADEIAVRLNSGATVGTRRRVNFVEGPNAVITVVDDPTDQEVDVTIDAIPGGAAASRIFNWVVYESGGTYYYMNTTTGTSVGDVSFWATMTNLIGAATAGDHIYIRNGTYTTNAQITINKSLNIYGAGYNTVIIVGTSFSGAIFRLTTAPKTYLANMYLDCDHDTDYGVHIDATANNVCDRVEMYRLEVIDADVTGIFIDNASGFYSNGHKIIQCIAGSCGEDGVYIGLDQTDVWVNRCTLRSNTRAGLALDGSGNQFDHNHLWGNDVGYLLAPNHAISRNTITGDYVEDNNLSEIYHATYGAVACHGSWDLTITDCVFWCASSNLSGGATDSLVYFNPPAGVYTSRMVMADNVFNCEYGVSAYANYGLYIGARNINSIYTNNIFYGHDIAGIYVGQTSNAITFNEGFKTEGHGTSAIASGTTTVTVTHGLDYTPALADISIALLEEATNDHGPIHLTNATSTTFDVTCRSDPGASNLGFGWHIIRTNLP